MIARTKPRTRHDNFVDMPPAYSAKTLKFNRTEIRIDKSVNILHGNNQLEISTPEDGVIEHSIFDERRIFKYQTTINATILQGIIDELVFVALRLRLTTGL